MNKESKVHLIGGILKTKCGKQLDCINYTVDINLCTCENCLKSKRKTGKKEILNSVL